MTELQKKQIAELRNKGYGYVRIARELGMNMETVKSHCRRQRVRKEQIEAAWERDEGQTVGKKQYCLQCGAEIRQIPGRKEKKFCGDSCRMKWWNHRYSTIKRKNTSDHACPNCGKIFELYGRPSQRKYCSYECYIEHRYGTKR